MIKIKTTKKISRRKNLRSNEFAPDEIFKNLKRKNLVKEKKIKGITISYNPFQMAGSWIGGIGYPMMIILFILISIIITPKNGVAYTSSPPLLFKILFLPVQAVYPFTDFISGFFGCSQLSTSANSACLNFNILRTFITIFIIGFVVGWLVHVLIKFLKSRNNS